MMDQIKKEIQNITVHIEASKVPGEYTLYLENQHIKKYVLSKYRPIENLEQTILKQVHNRDALFVVFGFAFGYPIEILEREVGTDYKLIIVEPDERSLNVQIQKRGNFTIKDDSNIDVFTGIDFEKFKSICQNNIGSSEANNIELVILEVYERYYPNYYKQILSIVREIREEVLININTSTYFGEKWVRNILRNREYIAKGKDIKKIHNYYKGVPAVIVSGGPSLDKNIQDLRGFKGVILVGGRTVAPVMNIGIKPDFVCSLDGDEETIDTFLEYAINDLNLITTPKSAHSVIVNNTGNQYYVGKEELIEAMLGISTVRNLKIGGSVATLCLSVAHYMGCNPIVFIGQDLAFSEGKAHTDLNQTMSIDINSDRGQREVPGYYGGKVVTDATLFRYLRWIEGFIQYYPDVQYINATEGGAFIEGATNKTLKEVVLEHGSIEKTELLIDNEREVVDVNEKVKEVLSTCKDFLEIVHKGQREAQKLLEEYKSYKGCRIEKINDILNELDKIDEYIIDMHDSKEIVTFIFDSKFAELNLNTRYKHSINESDQDKDLKIAELNYKMYTELRESIKKVINIIAETLGEENL